MHQGKIRSIKRERSLQGIDDFLFIIILSSRKKLMGKMEIRQTVTYLDDNFIQGTGTTQTAVTALEQCIYLP